MDHDKKRSSFIDGKYREITGIYHLAINIPAVGKHHSGLINIRTLQMIRNDSTLIGQKVWLLKSD